MVTSMIAAAVAATLCTPEIASQSLVRRMECQRALERGLDSPLLDLDVRTNTRKPDLPADRYLKGPPAT